MSTVPISRESLAPVRARLGALAGEPQPHAHGGPQFGAGRKLEHPGAGQHGHHDLPTQLQRIGLPACRQPLVQPQGVACGQPALRGFGVKPPDAVLAGHMFGQPQCEEIAAQLQRFIDRRCRLPQANAARDGRRGVGARQLLGHGRAVCARRPRPAAGECPDALRGSGPAYAMHSDRVASQRGWMQGARAPAKACALQARATPQTVPLRRNPQGSSAQPAPRR